MAPEHQGQLPVGMCLVAGSGGRDSTPSHQGRVSQARRWQHFGLHRAQSQAVHVGFSANFLPNQAL